MAKTKRSNAILMAVVLVVGIFGLVVAGGALSGCSSQGESSSTSGESAQETSQENQTSGESAQETSRENQASQEQGVEEVSKEVNDMSDYKGEIYKATIEVKDYGTIDMDLYPDIAPKTVENFVKLAKEGFYDGTTFHRIIKGFMIQGGDPTGTGMGGSDETIEGEFSANGHENNLSHERGVVSMARSQDYNSASSQFFIVQSDSVHLDGQYAAFGKVTSGMDVVDKIADDAKPADDNGTIPADAQPVITSITVTGPEQAQ